MKKLNSIKGTIVIIIVFCSMLHSAVAQINTQQWRKIHLQHIRPDMLAYWLDSAHQRIPFEYQEKFPRCLDDSVKNIFTQNLPSEMFSPRPKWSKPSDQVFNGLLAADNATGDLWVFSDKYIFDNTQGRAAGFDHPHLRIDLKVEAIAGDAQTIKAFADIKSSSTTTTKSTEIQSQLDQLIAQAKIKVLASFHVAPLDGFTGSATSFVSTPVVLNTHSAGIGSELAPGFEPQDLSYLVKYNFAVASPTLNHDGTVQVTVAVGIKTILTKRTPPKEIIDSWICNVTENPPITLQYIDTVCTLKNDQIMALGGFRTVNRLTNSKIINPETVCFITAHYEK